MSSPLAPWRARRWMRAVAGVGVLTLLTVGGSSMAEPDPTYPNAPQHGNGGFTAAYDSATLTYAKASKQWLRLPDVVLAASVNAFNTHPGAASAACLNAYGAAVCEPAPGADVRLFSDALTYPVATLPADHRATRFDTFPDATIKTVAFGAVPVQATLSLTLPTDAEGLPIGLSALTITDSYDPATSTVPAPPEVANPTITWIHIADTTVTGSVWVRIKALNVDGVPVSLGDHCRTVQPATLNLLGKGYTANATADQPAGTFTVGDGGTLKGTIDVPRFAGCGAGGDDLSALVSTMASGTGFSVEVQTGPLDGAHCFSANPDTINWSLCPPAPNLPIPTTAP